MINSKQKGKNGELEIAKMLRDMGFPARRTAQYAGNTGEAADVIGIEGIHIEVKRREKTDIHSWMAQAESECGNDVPCVFHRRNRERWLCTLPLIDFLQIVKDAKKL